jgi:hypothetical protein
MKTKAFLPLFILVTFYAKAQDNSPKKDTANVNVLQAPDSPGSNLVGIAASEVQKPSDVSSLVLQLQNATNNFSKIPSSFALDYAPWAKNKRIEDMMYSGRGIRNSLIFSLGVKSSSDEKLEKDSTQVGIGIKFSLLKGKYHDVTQKQIEEQVESLKKIADLQHSFYTIDNMLMDNNPEYKELLKKQKELNKTEAGSASEEARKIAKSLIELRKSIKVQSDTLKKQKAKEFLKSDKTTFSSYLSKVNQDKSDVDNLVTVMAEKQAVLSDSIFILTKEATVRLNEIKFRRYGWYLDVVGGMAFNFQDNVFSKGSIYKQAVWLNGGYESKCGFSFLGLLRYQYNPDKVFADEKKVLKTTNVNTLDFGGKLYYSQEKTRFSVSGEFVYRSVLDKSEIKPTYRLALNTTYELQDNTLLTLSLGRDFDKTIHKDGNVIAALNLIKGFGNKRTLSR